MLIEPASAVGSDQSRDAILPSRKEELEAAKRDIQKRVETITQEFLRQQTMMDEQMRRLQNEKHQLKEELDQMSSRVRQQPFFPHPAS